MRTQNIGEVSMVKYKGFGDLKWFQGAGIGIGDRGPEAFKLHYFVAQLNILWYEINFISVKDWIFLKKYKKSGPKCKETLPYTTTEGLANIMGL